MTETSREHRWSEATPQTCVRCGARRHRVGTYCHGEPREKAKISPKAAALIGLALALRSGR